MNDAPRQTRAPVGPQARRGPPPSAMRTRRRPPLPVDYRDAHLLPVKELVLGYPATNP